MNKADSDYVAAFLEQAGYSPTPVPEEADFILLNSCVVRQGAEDKVINKINALRGLKKKRPDITIAVTGCLVDSDTAGLKTRFPWIDFAFRPQQWEVLSEWAHAEGLKSPLGGSVPVPGHRQVTAFVPVMQGCNSFCSYCVVPYRRGRERSRGLDEVCYQVRALVQRGTREVTLLGQNIGAYGHDLPGKPDLADLLAEV
ncbi:MAG: radical SAM protein, partial [Chloroflexi bacterium]|nr:radical SAM protein [Chloroflexota bacterium]